MTEYKAPPEGPVYDPTNKTYYASVEGLLQDCKITQRPFPSCIHPAKANTPVDPDALEAWLADEGVPEDDIERWKDLASTDAERYTHDDTVSYDFPSYANQALHLECTHLTGIPADVRYNTVTKEARLFWCTGVKPDVDLGQCPSIEAAQAAAVVEVLRHLERQAKACANALNELTGVKPFKHAAFLFRFEGSSLQEVIKYRLIDINRRCHDCTDDQQDTRNFLARYIRNRGI